jgi:hypothetical protein
LQHSSWSSALSARRDREWSLTRWSRKPSERLPIGLRKFVNGGAEAKEPKWTVGWNLIEQCNRVLCTRVEQEIDQERSKIAALKREIDAVTSPVNRSGGVCAGSASAWRNIGRHFGGRDHSTVHHGIHNLEALLETDLALRNRVHRIAARFS